MDDHLGLAEVLRGGIKSGLVAKGVVRIGLRPGGGTGRQQSSGGRDSGVEQRGDGDRGQVAALKCLDCRSEACRRHGSSRLMLRVPAEAPAQTFQQCAHGGLLGGPNGGAGSGRAEIGLCELAGTKGLEDSLGAAYQDQLQGGPKRTRVSLAFGDLWKGVAVPARLTMLNGVMSIRRQGVGRQGPGVG